MHNNISKLYSLEQIANALKEARNTKGWSQRELSARSRIAQPQISRFENGDVDMQLSSLIELARALDLDLQLVPRSAVQAVAAVMKEREGEAEEAALRKTLKRLIQVVSTFEQTHPHLTSILHLKDAALEVEKMAYILVPKAANQVIGGVAQRLEDLATTQKRSPARFSRDIKAATQELRTLRNIAVHGQGLKQLPAYSLDEED